MLRKPSTCWIVLFVLAMLAGRARAETPAEQAAAFFARGEALLAQGKIDEAASAYVAAARAEPANQRYVQQALLLRRVQGLRRYVARSDLSERWISSARSLHLFYLQSGLPAPAVDLARTAHERMANATSAGWLAEAYLEAGQNVEAANLLAPYSDASPHLAAYHAIALARLGRAEDAARVGARATVGEDAEPAYLFDAARLRALLGRHEEALDLLRTSFERTPSAALPVSRTRARTSPDLASLTALPAFEAVLKTESKVKETCSGGSSCANCPNRGKCGGGR